jgi:cell division protein FtsL
MQPSGKDLVVSSKLKKLVWCLKLLYAALVVMALTFIVNTMVVNDQSFKVRQATNLTHFCIFSLRHYLPRRDYCKDM